MRRTQDNEKWRVYVARWCKARGLDFEVAHLRLSAQDDYGTARGYHAAQAAPKAVDQWLELAARKAGLCE